VRIAQISPLYESVPPKLYGGTERVVSYLTEKLVEAGHEVTLFASGDSQTKAKLVPVCEKALRLDNSCLDPVAYHFILIEEVLRRQVEFDIIHSHIDYIGFILARRTRVPVISTLHGRLDYKEHGMMLREFREHPLISISNAQRRPVPDVNWVGTVYHGLPLGLYRANENPEDYLAYVGRISSEKKIESAINIAMKSGMPLKIAAKVDKADLEYFTEVIRPLLEHPMIEFLGEVGEKDKEKLLAHAAAFLHPVDWPEPFGLAMIEAMACGTPVLGRRRGSVPEVVDHGLTGFVFEEDDEAVLHIKNHLSFFSRAECRKHFEKRFPVERMAADYERAYKARVAEQGESRKCLRLAR
jgi:glycosyltransferase involved in cell wall biosynthesis